MQLQAGQRQMASRHKHISMTPCLFPSSQATPKASAQGQPGKCSKFQVTLQPRHYLLLHANHLAQSSYPNVHHMIPVTLFTKQQPPLYLAQCFTLTPLRKWLEPCLGAARPGGLCAAVLFNESAASRSMCACCQPTELLIRYHAGWGIIT